MATKIASLPADAQPLAVPGYNAPKKEKAPKSLADRVSSQVTLAVIRNQMTVDELRRLTEKLNHLVTFATSNPNA